MEEAVLALVMELERETVGQEREPLEAEGLLPVMMVAEVGVALVIMVAE